MKRYSTSLTSRRNKIKLQWDTISQLLGWLYTKRPIIVSVDDNMEKLEPPIHCWWEHKMVYNQEIWIHMSTHKNPYMNIHSNIIHSSQKVEKPKCLSADEWINKMCYIHTVQYYLAVKRNKVQIHVITWIKLESIMLNEKISQNTTY